MFDSGVQRLFARPQEKLLELPLEYRWEFTRRHPYYLTAWRWAKAYHRGAPATDESESVSGYHAFLLLEQIGVTGEPVDPETSFDELDAGVEMDPGFMCGSVQPMTYRNILKNIIAALPGPELAKLGLILYFAGSEECAIQGDTPDLQFQRQNAFAELLSMESHHLDSYLDAPLYYIHKSASLRSIDDAIHRQIKLSKLRAGIEEKRARTEKLSDYLKVWDLNEGWTGAGYDAARSQGFGDIASALKKPKTTIINQHHSAYQLITGHEFSVINWCELFVPLQQRNESARTSHLRRMARWYSMAAPGMIPVAESRLGARECVGRGTGIIEGLSAVEDVAGLESDFYSDFSELTSKGWDDERIAEELEISVEMVSHVRDKRAGEGVGDVSN